MKRTLGVRDRLANVYENEMPGTLDSENACSGGDCWASYADGLEQYARDLERLRNGEETYSQMLDRTCVDDSVRAHNLRDAASKLAEEVWNGLSPDQREALSANDAGCDRPPFYQTMMGTAQRAWESLRDQRGFAGTWQQHGGAVSSGR